MISLSLLTPAIILGILLGGFYSLVGVGLSISFGLLKVVNVAHTSFMVLAAYLVLSINSAWGVDPIIAGLLLFPVFFAMGYLLYRFYDRAFTMRRLPQVMGLVFFLGVVVLIEVSLSLVYGLDYRSISVPYMAGAVTVAGMAIPKDLLIPFVIGVATVFAYYLFFTRTYMGLVVRGVAESLQAIRLVGCNPLGAESVAMGLSIASTALAGALLVSFQLVYPSEDALFLSLAFAVVILGGAGSIKGSMVAGIALGIGTDLTSAYISASWAPAFALILLIVIVLVRPRGMFRA